MPAKLKWMSCLLATKHCNIQYNNILFAAFYIYIYMLFCKSHLEGQENFMTRVNILQCMQLNMTLTRILNDYYLCILHKNVNPHPDCRPCMARVHIFMLKLDETITNHTVSFMCPKGELYDVIPKSVTFPRNFVYVFSMSPILVT